MGVLMVIGEFDKQGNGTQSSPITPNFEAGPDGPLGYYPHIWEFTGTETATTITVRYTTE